MADEKSADQNSFPTNAQVVIIGGGVIGCNIAYHLAKLGWKDVILLEQNQLTAGTTWHAAGLVEALGFTSATKIGMAKYTLELYAQLEKETGLATGFNPIGMLEIACSQPRLEEFRRVSAYARHFDVNIEEISPAEVQNLWPMMDSSDVLAGFLSPGDGRVNPIDVTMALAKGARKGGVRIFEETKVTGIKKKNNRVTGVITDKGEIEAEYVVNCAGMWAGEIGKMAGVNIPLQAAEHYYLITEPIVGVTPDLPVLVDPDRYAYYREEVGGILLGVFEPVGAPWAIDGIPKGFSFREIQPDWDRMIPYLEPIMDRIPIVKKSGIHKFFCGPESFTADASTLFGQAPELDNFFVAAGLNSLGILLGGGIGQIMADWIVNGVPDVDITGIDVGRMMPFQNTPKYRKDRTVEALGILFEVGYHNRQYTTARNIRKSAFHDKMVAANAYFGCYAGWEYPDWFAPKGIEPKVEYSWGRQNWFEYSAAEHRAARENVTLMDYSVMGKILAQGRDVEKCLNQICANDIAVPIGRCVYTPWLNETGSVLNVQGPKSRDFLSSITHTDMSNEAFPFLTMQEIDIGYAPVKALRVTYVGELGWELYIPTEFSLHVYDTLMKKGEAFGLKLIGLQALESLRLEKAYRDYGGDIDNTDTPLEVGLGYFVKFDKPGGFIGRDALLKLKESGYRYRMPQFLIEDPEPMLHYGEIIYRNGKPVGYIMAGSYGHTLGASVGVGPVENYGDLVTAEYIQSGSYEIDVAGTRYPAKVSLRPMYDPKLERVRR